MRIGSRAGQRRQRRFELLEALGGPLADELGGDVEVLDRAPVDAGRRPELIYQLAERARNARCKIKPQNRLMALIIP